MYGYKFGRYGIRSQEADNVEMDAVKKLQKFVMTDPGFRPWD